LEVKRIRSEARRRRGWGGGGSRGSIDLLSVENVGERDMRRGSVVEFRRA